MRVYVCSLLVYRSFESSHFLVKTSKRMHAEFKARKKMNDKEQGVLDFCCILYLLTLLWPCEKDRFRNICTQDTVFCNNLGNALPSGIHIPFFQTLQSQTPFKKKIKNSEMILSEKQCFIRNKGGSKFLKHHSRTLAQRELKKAIVLPCYLWLAGFCQSQLMLQANIAVCLELCLSLWTKYCLQRGKVPTNHSPDTLDFVSV